MNAEELISFFSDFYEDFDKNKAFNMLESLNISPKDKLKICLKEQKKKFN